MKLIQKKFLTVILAGAMLLGLPGCHGDDDEKETPSASHKPVGITSSSDWEPKTTVSLVVPAGAGSNADLSARVFAEYAEEMTGHEFFVINVSGQTGSLAADHVRTADPDGYTVLYDHNFVNLAEVAGITSYNYSRFKLGPTFAREPVEQFYVNSTKYADLNAFLQAAKAAPGTLKACAEVGSYPYYELLAFERAARIDLDLVDVGSPEDEVKAVLEGQVDLMPSTYHICKDSLAANQLLCVGIPANKRYQLLSNVSTLTEQGIDFAYPDYDFSFYFPAETPDAVIAWYEALVQQILADPGAQQAIAELDMMPYYLNGVDSISNDDAIYHTLKEIADATFVS